ncbi:MAG: UDP-N-acetylmuramoyl-tripeptide--D-alanyl-D-alanine ligase [Clostridiales bacterium]|jgi:UDP-N-acetylmuramoyl-tripeptide--D-alanyl-D-alanine ligase|nr:UDP-N-acetylmuramoyl-tripeptide--D-alanyl-D-alanine ligase [Clostridiales bacterium]
MMNLTVEEIMKACGGRLTNHETGAARDSSVFLKVLVSSVSTDSRSPAPGCLFVPIAGPRFDGHDYIAQMAAEGAVCALTEKEPDWAGTPSNFPLIRVDSTRRALLDIAAYYRSLFNVKVVAVTGSVGKTTTKDMVAHVLSQRYKTKKTEGNLNNDIGMPLSIFQLEAQDEVLVLEMGMNHFGEIRALSLVAKPDAALITNIGDAHIEFLGSREGILKAKLEITEGLDGGLLIVNGDDPLLFSIHEEKINPKIYFCMTERDGEKIETDIYATGVEPHGLNGTRCVFHINGNAREVTVPLPGPFMVMNALMAAAAGDYLGMSPEEIVRGIETFLPVSANRMEIVAANGMTVINDTYNASPTSMRAGIDVLTAGGETENGRKVCVFGDMLELGEHAEKLHRELGAYAATRRVDCLIAVGELGKFIYEGYIAAKGKAEALRFDDKAGFTEKWREILQPGDTVLIKASRGMAFEEIVNEITFEKR